MFTCRKNWFQQKASFVIVLLVEWMTLKVSWILDNGNSHFPTTAEGRWKVLRNLRGALHPTMKKPQCSAMPSVCFRGGKLRKFCVKRNTHLKRKYFLCIEICRSFRVTTHSQSEPNCQGGKNVSLLTHYFRSSPAAKCTTERHTTLKHLYKWLLLRKCYFTAINQECWIMDLCGFVCLCIPNTIHVQNKSIFITMHILSKNFLHLVIICMYVCFDYSQFQPSILIGKEAFNEYWCIYIQYTVHSIYSTTQRCFNHFFTPNPAIRQDATGLCVKNRFAVH